MGVAGVGQGAGEGGGHGDAHRPQACHQRGAAPESPDQGRGHGGQEVALGDASPVGVLGGGDHVGARVEGLQAQAGQDGVRLVGHRQGAAQPRLPLGGQPRVHCGARGGGHSLNGHVGDPRGVGVVEFAPVERAVRVEARADLEARHGAHSQGAGGGRHLRCGGDGVVVDGAHHPQSRAARQQGGVRGGVGAEGVAGVDVVVGLGDPFGERFPADGFPECCCALVLAEGRVVRGVHCWSSHHGHWVAMKCGDGAGAVLAWRVPRPRRWSAWRTGRGRTGKGSTARPMAFTGPPC